MLINYIGKMIRMAAHKTPSTEYIKFVTSIFKCWRQDTVFFLFNSENVRADEQRI